MSLPYDAYCPECGEKINHYRFSLVNLFRSSDANSDSDFMKLFNFDHVQLTTEDSEENADEKKEEILHQLYNHIVSAMDNKNAIVQLAFSMENAIPNGTTIINLQELYGFANMLPQTQFSWLYPTDEEFDKAWKEYTTIYSFMQNNFSICQICLPPNCKQIQSKDYLTKLLMPGSEQNRIVRICDKCGEHVDPYLNIYPQKIISFAGTPATGKSAMLASFYKHLYKLHVDGHLQVAFDWDSPNYEIYTEARKKIDKKMAPGKTAVGESPSLTVRLSHTDNEDWTIYTFVDSPGELFTGNNPNANFKRRTIIAQSDVLLVLFSSEQLFPQMTKNSENNAVQADVHALDSFTNLYRKVLVHRTKVDPIHKIIVISKTDQIFNERDLLHSQMLNGTSYMLPTTLELTMIHKPMLEEDYNNLCKQLNIQPAFEIEGAGLKCDSFAAISCLMKKFLLTMNRISIDNTMSCLYNFAFTNNDLKNISACLVSPFGFAALHDFNCAETEEGNHKKEQLLQMIQDHYPQYFETESPTEEQFQTACEIAYLKKHTADGPKGVYHCLFHILYSTGFLVKPYVYSKEQAEKENELLKERLSAARKAIQGKEKIKKDYLDSIKWTDIVTKGKWIHKADYDRTLRKCIGQFEIQQKNKEEEIADLTEKYNEYFGYII